MVHIWKYHLLSSNSLNKNYPRSPRCWAGVPVLLSSSIYQLPSQQGTRQERKTVDERGAFPEKWTDGQIFVKTINRALHFISNEITSVIKAYNSVVALWFLLPVSTSEHHVKPWELKSSRSASVDRLFGHFGSSDGRGGAAFRRTWRAEEARRSCWQDSGCSLWVCREEKSTCFHAECCSATARMLCRILETLVSLIWFDFVRSSKLPFLLRSLPLFFLC